MQIHYINHIRTYSIFCILLLFPAVGYTQPQFLKIDRDSVHFSAANSTIVVQLTSNRSWILARSNNIWLSVSQEQGSGDCPLSITVTANNGEARRGQLTIIAGSIVRDLYIRQEGAMLSVDKETILLNPSGETKPVQILCNREWSVNSYPSWLSVSPMNGTGNMPLMIDASENSGPARTGEISITSGTKSITLQVTQENDMLEIDMDTLWLNSSTGRYFVTLQCNRNWSLNNSSSWLSVSPISGNGNVQLLIDASTNNGPFRNGNLIITAGSKSKTLHVVQRITSGIGDIPVQEAINIYPNPNTGLFHVDLGKLNGNKTITISDITGRIVKSLFTSNQSIDVSLAMPEKGIYFLKVQTTDGITTQKILIQ
jgi:hypothetical protein